MVSSVTIRTWLAIGVMGLSANLYAHKFDIAVVAPYSSDEAQVGEQLWNGMRVATRERDGHSFETSDGHLGGVDSNLIRLDSESAPEVLAQNLRQMAQAQGFLIAVFAPDETGLSELVPFDIPHVIILTESDAAPGPNRLNPVLNDDRTEEQFRRSYRQQYNQEPTDIALSGYTAARLIDGAIRQTDGDFTHSSAVQAAFMQAIRNMAQ